MIPDSRHASSAVARSPVSTTDFDDMQRSALFGADDVRYLQMSYAVLEDQVEAVLDVWYGFIGSQPQLLASFVDPTTGTPSAAYLGGVRQRFARWILDTARAEYDQAWLDYQHEIGLRHHRVKKNQTDAVVASAIVPFRYLFALVYPVTHTLKPFLSRRGHSQDDVDKMHAAWVKSCLLQLTLWSYPYVGTDDF